MSTRKAKIPPHLMLLKHKQVIAFPVLRIISWLLVALRVSLQIPIWGPPCALPSHLIHHTTLNLCSSHSGFLALPRTHLFSLLQIHSPIQSAADLLSTDNPELTSHHHPLPQSFVQTSSSQWDFSWPYI